MMMLLAFGAQTAPCAASTGAAVAAATAAAAALAKSGFASEAPAPVDAPVQGFFFFLHDIVFGLCSLHRDHSMNSSII